jgi:hypothetical protein
LARLLFYENFYNNSNESSFNLGLEKRGKTDLKLSALIHIQKILKVYNNLSAAKSSFMPKVFIIQPQNKSRIPQSSERLLYQVELTNSIVNELPLLLHNLLQTINCFFRFFFRFCKPSSHELAKSITIHISIKGFCCSAVIF